ncbi:hypothetical protein M0805_001268 [Coniferiporia weirii]|nr:hypothetical protein M0805_001268 [Coniferiporia weirii]
MSSVGPESTITFDIPSFLPDFSVFLRDTDFDIEGAGHYADIYSAALGKKRLALKVLRRFSFSSPLELKKNFNYELVSWLKVGLHPNILGLTGIYHTFLAGPERQPGFLSEWQENKEITNYLKTNPEADIIGVIQGILSGLGHMHKKGVIHGDLRGGNILASKEGVPKIADFGLSKLFGRDSSNSGCAGTIRWMARELLEADPKASGYEASSRRSTASDVWSAGMTILELFSGAHPFFNFKIEAYVVQVIVQGRLPDFPGALHDHWKKYEASLISLCKSCWIREPHHRPDVDDLLARIRKTELEGDTNGDNKPEDQSLTPRLHPRDSPLDHLSRDISSFRLASPTEDLSITVEFPQEPVNQDFPERRFPIAGELSRQSSPTNQGEAGNSTDVVNEPLKGNKISYMTALRNHFVLSRQLRKCLVQSSSCGPAHAPTWSVSILVDGIVLGEAPGSSKKLAQEEAAKQAYAVVERENISPSVPYLPVFMNRLNAHGLRDQFRWHTEVCNDWRNTCLTSWSSTLYRGNTIVGMGQGISHTSAEEEAARAASMISF